MSRSSASVIAQVNAFLDWFQIEHRVFADLLDDEVIQILQEEKLIPSALRLASLETIHITGIDMGPALALVDAATVYETGMGTNM